MVKALHQPNNTNNVYILFNLILASVSLNYIWHIYKLKNKEKVGLGIKKKWSSFISPTELIKRKRLGWEKSFLINIIFE